MNLITNLLTILKLYKKELLIIKIFVLVIINIWLIIIFWKIILLNETNVNLTNNNIALVKMQTWLQPILEVLGLNVFNANTFKMLIITIIIIISNLAVLYFSQMMAFLLLGMTARYSYKAYSNYINKETLNYYGFEKLLELTLDEKTKILKEFIIEKNIKDENVIGYLNHKMIELNCINKNELILSLNANYIEYKQLLLSKIVIEQKEQILTLQNNTLWNTLDLNTILKIGCAVIIIGGVLWFGYSYYNNNAVKTAGDMSQEVLKANKQITEAIAKSTEQQNIMITEKITDIATIVSENSNKSFKMLNDEMLNINAKSMDFHTEIYNKMRDYNTIILNNNISIHDQMLLDHKALMAEGSKMIEIMKSNNNDMINLTLEVGKINNNLVNISNNIDPIILKTEELDTIINGGELVLNKIENGVLINQTMECPSLLEQVKEISDTTTVLTNSIEAVLAYLGLDTIRLTEQSLTMLGRIRRANIENNVMNIDEDEANPEL